ncbi:MAG: GT2 family glycosyltransferase [Planctomycetota bacterium]|jgi:GT2 family glycosyltransferase
MSALLELYAVVVNWNGGELNRECLESLRSEGIAADHIVFVDNASVDGSLEDIKSRFPGLLVFQNDSNLGFGEAANQGADLALEAGADSVFYVNNDLLLEAGCLAKLTLFMRQHPEVGICGPRVLMRDDPSLVWCAGGILSWRQNLSTLRGFQTKDGPEFQTELEVDYIPGCSLIATAELLGKIGGYDAAYFAYMEDVDLCLRATKAGFKVVLVGEASTLHKSSAATGGGYNPRRKYMMGVNSIWFLRAHGGPFEWMCFFVFDVLSLPPLFLLGLFNGRANSVAAKARGIFDGLRGKRVSAASAS